MKNDVVKFKAHSSYQEVHRNLIEKYKLILDHQNKSSHTIKSYNADLTKLLNWWHAYRPNKPLWKIKSYDIGEFITLLKNGGKVYSKSRSWKVPFREEIHRFEISPLSISSQKRTLSTVNGFFNFLSSIERDYPFWKKKFKSSPIVKHLHDIKLKDQDIDHTENFPAKDWEHLLEQAWKVDEKLVLHLMFFAGLRLAEVAKLKKSDFNHRTGEINTIRKGGKRHNFFVQKASTIEKLWMAQEQRSQGEFLFPNRYKDSHISERAMYQRVKNLIKKAGLSDKISPHSFRKSCATELYSNTKDLLLVRDYLNHSDAKVTQTYIETSPDTQKNYEVFCHP